MSQQLEQATAQIHPPLYEADFYAWTQVQAAALRAGDWHRLDVPHVIEEIDSLGRQERQQLRNRLAILIGHLLKWQFQPTHRSKSWRATIREQRRRLTLLLDESPSLQSYVQEGLAIAYELAKDLVVQETPLDYADLPETCPYEWEELLDVEFWPD